jgi:diguanylate cyclase (GGDEF)-like protein/PAS domain S-box-containing protein
MHLTTRSQVGAPETGNPSSARDGAATALAYLSRAAFLVLAVDPTGTIIWSSPVAGQLAALPDTPVGTSVMDLLHPGDVGPATAALERVTRRPGAHQPLRCRVVNRDGSTSWVACRADNALDDPDVGAIVISLRYADAEARVEEALEASERYVRTILDSAPVVLLTFDRDRRVTYCAGNLGTFNVNHPVLLGADIAALAPGTSYLREVNRVLGGEHVDLVFSSPEWGIVVDIKATPILRGDTVVGGAVVATDITGHQQAHERLVVSEERFRSLVQHSSDIAMIFEPDMRMTYVSPSVRLFGYDADRITGNFLQDYCHPDDVEAAIASFRQLEGRPGTAVTVELRVRDAHGHYRWVEQVLANHVDDPAVGGIVGNLRDVTERKRAEQNLDRMALTDSLTGLPNRTEFTNRLREAIERAREHDHRVTVVFLDIDQFKLINESLGHDRGDDLLREVAGRLRSRVRDGDLVARFGGDEFVVLVEGGDESLPVQVAERMASAFDSPIEIGDGTYFLTASFGVASTPPHEADTVLRNADAAMYRAKELGRARIEFFDAKVGQDVTDVLQIRNELRRGIDEQEFVLHFQPIMDLSSRRIDGMEALVRWQHPTRGMVPPLAFIPAAEDSGLIVELGAWVLRQSCIEAATWPGELHVAVNLSVRQLADRAIVSVVADALQASGLSPGRLVLEVTESALMANAEMALSCLQDLKALGVRLAIDDFGTGYSSLVYLKRMPVDAIKVDRSFVDGLGDDQEDTAIVSSVISLAHAVGVQAIAEGVETEAQQGHLQDLGCDLAQGYLWSRPVPAADLIALLAADAASATPSENLG